MNWMILPLKRYAEFSGRSRRKEFWMFALLQAIVLTVLYAIIFATAGSSTMLGGAGMESAIASGGFGIGFMLIGLWVLAMIIPSIAVSVRRLHDREMSGWWYLGYVVASFIPLLNFIAFIAYVVIMALPGTPGPNKYGEDPKSQSVEEVFS